MHDTVRASYSIVLNRVDKHRLCNHMPLHVYLGKWTSLGQSLYFTNYTVFYSENTTLPFDTSCKYLSRVHSILNHRYFIWRRLKWSVSSETKNKDDLLCSSININSLITPISEIEKTNFGNNTLPILETLSLDLRIFCIVISHNFSCWIKFHIDLLVTDTTRPWIKLESFQTSAHYIPVVGLKGYWTSITSSPYFFQKKLGFLYH